MAKMTTAQIMEKVAKLLPELNEEGMKMAQYNLNGYTKNPKSITAREAKELYYDLYENYLAEDEVEMDEDTVEMESKVIPPVVVENSLKKSNGNKKSTKSADEIAAEKIVSIMEASNKKIKENKLKSKKQQEVVYDKAPTEEEIVELVGYRYAYPKFPLEFNCRALNGVRLINREDIKTLKDFKAEEEALYKKTGKDDNFFIAVYVKEEDIVDSRMYDYLNLYPNQSFKSMLKPFGIEHFPQELDILRIIHISEKVVIATSMYTDIPYIFTYNRFKNNEKLHCRANFMGLDFQIYQVEQ